jgi:putative tryptophan/tyrosine transport system substrate-binding protein
VNRNVELIVAFSNAEAIAVKRATKTIPIVLLWGSAPVEDGLVASLTHPGGNLTGTTYFEPILLTRSFQFLREAKPSARRVAVVGTPSYIGYREGMDAVARLAPSLGIQLGYFDVTHTDQLPAMLEKVGAWRPDALFFLQGHLFYYRVTEIAAFALEHKLPSIGSIPGWTSRGGLLAYHSDTDETIGRCASFVDRILRGAKPADMPVEMPSRYDLSINMKTAKALSLTIPQSLLTQATHVIQ